MDLATRSYGSGPRVLLLHGLFGSGDNLRSIARGLQDRFEVILPDLPNHGESPHTDSATYSVMVNAAADLLDGLSNGSGQPIIVGGHSMGGKVAMQLALEHASLVRALVALDIAPRGYEPSHIELMDSLRSLDLSSVTTRGEADEALSAAIPSKPVRSFLLTNLVKDGNSYRWRLNLEALRADYENIISWQGSGTYDGPALFLGGDRSKYLQRERDEKVIARHFPNASIEIIEDAGHWLHSDQPDHVREHLSSFLASL